MESAAPLNALLVDQDSVDTERVATALQGLIGIDSRTGAIVLGTGFAGLNSEQKVVAILLGRFCANLLSLSAEVTMAPKEVILTSGLPSGTVHPALKSLREKRRLTAQDEAKRYYIPRSKIIAATEALANALGS